LQKKIELILKCFFFKSVNQATTQPSKNNMSFSKTRTTYCPSTHPKNKTNPSANIEISIQVFPAPTYAELCNLRNKLPMDANCDQIAWKHALDMEIRRCAPPPAWSRKEQAPPTQHARIGSAQAEQLKDLLKPETLRRTFISMPALMAQIQADILSKR
jgi:hypothetical protein